MPDNGVVEGPAGRLVPDQGGLALVGEPDRHDLNVGGGLRETASDRVADRAENGDGIMFAPSSLGVDLREIDLMGANGEAGCVV